MWVAGLASWGWALFLLNCAFPTSEEVHNVSENRSEKARLVLQRICGLLPPVGIAFGFLFAADNSGCIKQCVILAVMSLGVAVSLWFSFKPLHRVHDRLVAAQSTRARKKHFENVGDVRADTFSKWAIIVAWTISAVIFVSLTLQPVVFGKALGSPAVILFAIAVWVSAGSAVIYVACLYRVPILTVLLLWAMLCSFFNDNHDVRTLPANPAANAPARIFTALDQWHTAVTKDYPLLGINQKRPLYLVTAAGGGIRAAYWTAAVLGELEDCSRSNGTSFASHTFIMSGVSGGSLGEVTFVALLVHGHGGTNFMGNARELLKDDFLAADLAKMAFADLLQRFLPFPIRHFDRARSLEDAWAASWGAEFHTNVLDESIGQLYAEASNANVILPHLLLNGTSVETGQRIITSDLTVRSRVMAKGREDSSGNFLDIIAASDKLSNAPIRLSTAAHQSARFTYFSPAGRFPDGTHIVDGGYFENSGASTLMDALNAIQWYIASKKWTDVEPRLILIDNEPIPLQSTTNPSRFLRETLSPIRTLFNTRTARGNYAVEQALDYNWKATNIYQFDLYEREESEPLGKCQTPAKLPLGWTLSQCDMNEMDAQLTLPFREATNSYTISNIIATLPRYSPTQQ